MTLIVALSVLGGVDGLQGYGVSLFTPEVARTLQVGVVSVISARALALVLGAALPLVVPRLSMSRRPGVTVWVCRVAAVATALTFALTGLVRSPGALVAVLCVTSILSAPGRALSRSTVVAAADPARRMRSLAVLQVAVVGGQLLLALAAAVGIWTTWHRLVVWLGGLAVVAALLVSASLGSSVTLGVADVSTAIGAESPPADEQSWKETVRGWRLTPSLVGVGVAMLAVGMLIMPFDAVLAVYLHGRWHLALRGTGVVFLIMSVTSLLAVIGSATRSDAVLAISPSRLASRSTRSLALGAALLGVGALISVRGLMVVAVSVGAAAIAALVPDLAGVAFAIVPPRQHRALSSALAGAMSAGSLIGVVVATSFANRHGPRSALVAMSVLALIAAAWLRVNSSAASEDQRRGPAGDVETSAPSSGGRDSELLECRGIDFSYGSLQVLYDVDFRVHAGEVVALLGTNGAGKSTMLKVISGLGLPQRGSVSLTGRDITFLDAEDRVGLGISQITGGQAVFGSMDVIENLQCFGYSLGRSRHTVDEAIERCLEAFPQLSSRRSSLAATLSGGEQQMLGLAKALMLQPRLLLIDELALGLAPGVVGPLLNMVRRINADGTAVVIVEQSVNIALSVVDRACFMEKGALRFDGPARDLLDRRDLLRAVFLEGAAKAALE